MDDKDRYESKACNCVEVGTVIREDDKVLIVNLSGVDVEQQLDDLAEAAHQVGSGNCKVTSETIDQDGVPAIRAMLDFDCTAEKLIFEMKHS